MSGSTWPSPLTEQLRFALAGDLVWDDLLGRSTLPGVAPYGVHLAVLIEPYLQLILDGRKTVESRFARRRCPPYGYIDRGDVILLKRSGGPIVGLCRVADVWLQERKGGTWQSVQERFAAPLCAQDSAFWREREEMSFATLVRLVHVRSLMPGIDYAKRDRRGWVVLQRANAADDGTRYDDRG